jgi:hypothetical protein
MTDYQQYLEYYQNQALGRATGGISKRPRSQKGDGLGSFLSSIFARVFPYIKSGVKAAGKELYSTGVGLLKDYLNNTNMKESVQTRLGNAGKTLGEKTAASVQDMMGMGYKHQRLYPGSQSKPVKRLKKTSEKCRPRRKRDIFGF